MVRVMSGVPAALGTVLAATVELAQSGEWDRTRNSSAGFCSPSCRSQASMRAYRARRKQNEHGRPGQP
jgi:hypothetical protein